jgi:hypothetical protein
LSHLFVYVYLSASAAFSISRFYKLLVISVGGNFGQFLHGCHQRGSHERFELQEYLRDTCFGVKQECLQKNAAKYDDFRVSDYNKDSNVIS